MTTTRPDTPLPAPLPYATQAGRDEIPAPKQSPRPAPNPGGPILSEDETTLWLCTAIVAAFIVLMVAVAASGGL